MSNTVNAENPVMIYLRRRDAEMRAMASQIAALTTEVAALKHRIGEWERAFEDTPTVQPVAPTIEEALAWKRNLRA